MTTDKNAEKCHDEMYREADYLRNKHRVSNLVMNHICADLAMCYAAKAVAEAELNGGPTQHLMTPRNKINAD